MIANVLARSSPWLRILVNLVPSRAGMCRDMNNGHRSTLVFFRLYLAS
jgi:hypothetical protein